MEIINKEVTIIGGGVAGSTVALYLARAGHKPMLITSDEIGGNLNQIETIQNFVGVYNAKGSDIASSIAKQLEQAGLEEDEDILLDSYVLSIEPEFDSYLITYCDIFGETYKVRSKYVVVATGQSYLELDNLPEEIIQHHCVLCDGFMFKDKDVVVIGGGNSALTEALELAKTSKNVYLVTRRKEFRAEEILQQEVLKTKNIHHSVGNLKSVNDNLYTFDTHSLRADGLFVYIGAKPNNNFLEDVELDEFGYVDTFNNKVTLGIDESRHVELKSNYYAIGDINGSVEAKQFGIAIGQATEVATELIRKLK